MQTGKIQIAFLYGIFPVRTKRTVTGDQAFGGCFSWLLFGVFWGLANSGLGQIGRNTKQQDQRGMRHTHRYFSVKFQILQVPSR